MRAADTDPTADAIRFAAEKSTFLRFADTVRKAQNAKQRLDLLQADITAPYHSFDLLGVAGATESIGSELAFLLDQSIDDMGVLGEQD